MLPNDILEIHPLVANTSTLPKCKIKTQQIINPHLIKKNSNSHKIFPKHLISKRDILAHQQHQNLTIELILFTDLSLFKKLLPVTNGKFNKMREIIDGIMNGVNAIFQHASFGVPMSVVMVKYVKLLDDFRFFPNHNGDTSSDLLQAFCSYQKNLYAVNTSSLHWDLALLLTGRDLYNENDTILKSVTGTANLSSMCSLYSCAISEYGVVYKNYATNGFNIIYTIAHEIGHT